MSGAPGFVVCTGLVLIGLAAPVRAEQGRPACSRLTLRPLEREPAQGRDKLDREALAALRGAVEANPRDRSRRFDVVKALMNSGQLREALAEARAWRAKDAYNLVVVRMMGDILAKLGDLQGARRAYSAVVELLSGDPEAHRALATVMRESGDLQGAYDRLAVAGKLRPGDPRVAFELADAAHRLERTDEAVGRFREIVAQRGADPAVSYPARQRLAQIHAAQRRSALRSGDRAAAQRMEQSIAALAVQGGAVNALKVYLTWDTDRTDVDLWVTSPSGERVFYSNKRGKLGEELFHDVTEGYGPESFTAHQVACGTYRVEVDYFGTGRPGGGEARGEVTVILNEGTDEEQRHVLPYRLFKVKQTVTVAEIVVQ
jgi:Flp pilus assembly protein TadD